MSLILPTHVFASDSASGGESRKAWTPLEVGTQTVMGGVGAGVGLVTFGVAGAVLLVGNSSGCGRVCDTLLFSGVFAGMTTGAALGVYGIGRGTFETRGKLVPTIVGAGIGSLAGMGTGLVLAKHGFGDRVTPWVSAFLLAGIGATSGYQLFPETITPIARIDKNGSFQAGVAVQVVSF